MPKELPTVEAANALDDNVYKERFVPELILEYDALWLEFASAAELSRREKVVGKANSELEACFQILKSTSYDDYKGSSINWSTSDKRKELRLPDMRYVLVRDRDDDSVQGFISFMITYEDGYEVVYIYEIHLVEAQRRKHLGARLVSIVEEVGRRAGMTKVMLTVFTSNHAASSFYERIGYTTDDFSPQPRKLRNGVVKEPDYRILSRQLKNAENLNA